MASAFLLFFALAFSSPVFAQANIPEPPVPPIDSDANLTVQDACSDGKWDTNNAQERSNFAQIQYQRAHNINTLFPMLPALNACVQQMTKLLQMLPTIGNPFDATSFIVTMVLNAVIGQVCSSIMGTVQSVENAITSMAKICLPMPHFNGLDLPKFGSTSCSGALQLNFITGWGAQQSPYTPDYTKFMRP
jgi:hypothetical protein